MSLYLNPEEIMQKYPELETKLGWSKSDLGVFLRNKVLHGYYSRNKKKSLIDEQSLLELISFINKNLEAQKVNLQAI